MMSITETAPQRNRSTAFKVHIFMEINTMYHVSGQTSQCYIKQLIPQINNIYHVSGQTSQCYI